MVVRHDAAALGRGVKRQAKQLDQVLQLGLGARPENAAAGEHERAFRPSQQAQRVVDHRRVAAWTGAERRRVGIRVDDIVLLDLFVKHVAGHIEIHRTRPAAQGLPHGGRDELGHTSGICALLGPLGDRFEGRHLIHLLECALAALADRRRATDREQRRAVGPGIGDPGDQVGRAWTRGSHTHADGVLHPTEGMRHHRGGLFVTDVDRPQAFLEAGGLGRHHRTAHDVKEGVRLKPAQAARQNLRAVDQCHELDDLLSTQCI